MLKDGTVEVKGGRIIVTDPEEGGACAKLSCGAGISLFIDGKEAKGFEAVTSSSKIEVKVGQKEPQRELEVKIDNEGLKAEILIRYRDGEKSALKNRFPSSEVVLDTMSGGRIECPHYTMQEALEELKQKGVVYGLIEDSISQAISKGADTPVVIAEAELPVDEIDDTIDVKFDDVKKPVELKDRVDFYSIGKVISVDPGELLAEVVCGSEGKPGTSVQGEPIQYKKGMRIRLKAGRGARVSEDGMKAYSSIMGRPTIKGNIVTVSEVYEVGSDVDISTGNIEFSGDIVIKGNINEGMKVRAGNNVILFGSVTGGEISAGGDILVHKNIISATVNAGRIDFLKHSIIEIVDFIAKKLESIFSGIKALKETGKIPKTYSDGKIIKLLIDTKYGELSQKVVELRNTMADNKELLDMDVLKVGAMLVKYFMGNGPLLIEKSGDLQKHISMIHNLSAELKEQLKEPSHITAHYVQSSQLCTSGDIKVEGKGCYTSNLTCRGNVSIEKRGSIVRGGTIKAGGSVSIWELGSQGGAPTFVSAGEDGTVICEIAHINSTVGIGNMSCKLEESVKKLKAHTYKGELMVEKSKL